MSTDSTQLYNPEQLRKAALEFKIIAGKNLATLLNLSEDDKTDNVVKFIESIVHASVLEVSALVQQAGQMATDVTIVKNLQNE